MFAAYLIMLREGIEAAPILGGEFIVPLGGAPRLTSLHDQARLESVRKLRG
jgi:hypothetical protein